MASVDVSLCRPAHLPGSLDYQRREFKLFNPRLRGPDSFTVVEGRRLEFTPPPDIPLKTENRLEILQLLEYAGVPFNHPISPAATLGVEAFAAGRNFARETQRVRIAWDWDHTLDNYQIFESLLRLVWTKLHTEYPFKGQDDKENPLTSLETARPFMHALAFGMMVGFASRQGLERFPQWESYKPQVGLVTLTWPDRLGVLSRHIPLLSLMDARFPGRGDSYTRAVQSRTFIHLHHFVDYGVRLLTQFQGRQFNGMTPQEAADVMTLLRSRRPHDEKPLGAIDEQWGIGGLMLFEDDPHVCAAYLRESAYKGVLAVHCRNPYTEPGKRVGDPYKVTVGFTREGRIRKGAERLAWAESQTQVPALMRFLLSMRGGGQAPKFADYSDLSPTPDGAILELHEVGTSLQEFHEYYVVPTRRLKQLVRGTIETVGGRRGGGMHWIEGLYERARASRERT